VRVLSSIIDHSIIRRDAKISSLYHVVIFYPILIYNCTVCCCHRGRCPAENLIDDRFSNLAEKRDSGISKQELFQHLVELSVVMKLLLLSNERRLEKICDTLLLISLLQLEEK